MADTSRRQGVSRTDSGQGTPSRPDPADGHGHDVPYVDPNDPIKPDKIRELTKPTWVGVMKRSLKKFKADNCTDWAAALTYYAVLALFPAMIVLVSLIGLVSDGQHTINTLLDMVRGLGPKTAVDSLKGPITDVVQQRSAAGPLLILGLLGALWSASGYVGAFTRAANVIYRVEEGRRFYKLKPLQVLITLVCLVLVAIVAIGLVVSGPVAKSVGNVIGAGGTAVTVWNYAKWPVLLLVVCLLLSLLYWVAPNVKQPRFRWFTIGGLLALVVWVIASVAFGFYVANFGSYNKTYGSLGAVIIFLVWLYLTNCAILLGAEVNAEVERGRELQADLDAEDQLLLPPRDPADDR